MNTGICRKCQAPATGRVSIDMDLNGIPHCADHERWVRNFLYWLCVNSAGMQSEKRAIKNAEEMADTMESAE